MRSSYWTSILIIAVVALTMGRSAAIIDAGQGVPAVDGDDIGGFVTSAKGPEAGGWVIAETHDLPTGFRKIVVTDERGRYVVPDLPKAVYDVWVRGYGLVDSPKVNAVPGNTLNLRGVLASSAAAAAHYYPANYWLSLIKPPSRNEFPGTGSKGNGIAVSMTTQEEFLGLMAENGCATCHQLGSRITRELPAGGGP